MSFIAVSCAALGGQPRYQSLERFDPEQNDGVAED